MNTSPVKTPMPTQPPKERVLNFGEVALGYSDEEARTEAERCLGCKTQPCVAGCPVGVPIPEFISLLRAGRTEEAYRAVSRVNSLPAVCGRVCPQERQCESKCTRALKGEAVAIGGLERYVADACGGMLSPPPVSNGRRTAVVGSGPAGLACAGELCRLGYEVTVFEALHVAGGVLVYGIPEFRLPQEVVRREVERLSARGVRFVTDAVAGRSLTLAQLKEEGFEAVFLGTGAGLPKFSGIEGENAGGVLSANEYLTRVNLMKAYEEDSETPVYRGGRTVVVGGGNVAMDAARTARRLGAQVTVVYRRSREELPARAEEVRHAEEEGVEFLFLAEPVKILTEEERVVGVRCVRMTLGEADASGRRRPIRGTEEFSVGADHVIMALGTVPNPLPGGGLATGAHGEILADGEGRTSCEWVFAGGDAVTGSATVILAMGAGKRAAGAIDRYLQSK